MPEISVLMPVYNMGSGAKEGYLRQAVQSIIDQTFKDWELVVVDDGSTDATTRILADYVAQEPRIRLIKNDVNLKIVKSLNRGIDACQGKYIARMDSDDISTVTRLQVQRAFMADRPGTSMCGTGMYVINSEGKLEMELRHVCPYQSCKDFLKNTGCCFVHGSVMCRTEVMQNLRYSDDPALEYAEDYDLWVRMAAEHVVENIPDVILYYHRNHKSTSSNVNAVQQQRATQVILNKAKTLL